MFVCQNQPCGAHWSLDEVEIRNEGQGPLFRCPMCGARNHLEARKGRDGALQYRQVTHASAAPAEVRPAKPAPQRGKRH